MSTTTQATDLLAAWERYNASLEALIESADGEYQEQRRFSAFEAGWRDGGNASVDATLRDTLVLAAGKRIDDLERALAAATARAVALEKPLRGMLEFIVDETGESTFIDGNDTEAWIYQARAALAAAATEPNIRICKGCRGPYHGRALLPSDCERAAAAATGGDDGE